ncbi:MAG TPA: SDR family oxidoreductase [Propionibacteriaceae bacterium]|nr:SDR family oxidoreductase [Propionibacteriaceae bacterium]
MTSPVVSPLPLALVVGGSRGLGLLIARELGQRGHRVVIAARDPEELDRARLQLAGNGLAVSTQVCDVADESDVNAMIDRVESEVGPILVLLHVAGIISVGPLESMSRSDFREAIDIMLWGPINTSLAAVAHMKSRRSGRIGIVTSIGGLVSVPHLLPYSTAKFGAVGFSRGLRAELAGSGITVTTITPGLMRTGSHVRAKFVGKQRAEYAWFSASASLPLISMDAERAAEHIVDGVLAGRANVVLTPLAKIAMRVNGVAPSTAAALLGVMARVLPAPPKHTRTTPVEGRWIQRRLPPMASGLVRRVTTLGARAASRNNEQPLWSGHR